MPLTDFNFRQLQSYSSNVYASPLGIRILMMDYTCNSTRDQVGSAVVFFDDVKASSPTILVRATAITDLRSTNPGGLVRERGCCQVKIFDKWYPCIVVEINELGTVAEQIVKVQEDEIHLQRRGENIALEFGFSRIPRTGMEQGPLFQPSTVSSSPSPGPENMARDATFKPTGPTSGGNGTRNDGERRDVPELRKSLESQPRQNPTEITMCGDEDVIYKMSHSGFYSANVHARRSVAPLPEFLASLPVEVWSHYYGQNIQVADLRHGMWQRNTWQDAANEALHCLYSEDDLAHCVATPAASEHRQKRLLDQTRRNVIRDLSGEICKELYGKELVYQIFRKHVMTHKSILRARMGLPRKRKRPNVSKPDGTEGPGSEDSD